MAPVLGLLLLAGCATSSPEQLRRAEIRRDLGTVYLNKGEVEMAIREYREAVEAYDRDAETHFALGEAYRRKGEFVAAEQHFLRALALDATKLDARLNLGVLYLQEQRWSEAVEQNRILVRDPTFLNPARALVNMGWAQYNSKDFEGAESSLRRALSLDPSSYRAHVNLAILLYEQSQIIDAVKHFENAIDSMQGRPVEFFGLAEAEVRFRTAMAHVQLGQRDRAVEHLRVASERGGQTEWGQKSRDYLAVLE
jgi:type IV pilus biogenesis/stability protein PilW